MAEQTKDTAARARLAGAIARRVQIRDVRLISSELKRSALADDDLSETLHLRFGFKVEHGLDSNKNRVSAVIAFLVHGKPSEDENAPDTFRIESSFALDYQLTGDDPVTDDEVSEFSKLNGIYNAWPYWREYVQSTVTRMGLPSLVLPVLTPSAIEKMVREDEEKSESTSEEAGQEAGESAGSNP